MSYIATYLLLIGCWMSAWFAIALYRKDNSVVDTAWGLGFVLIAGYGLLRYSVYSPQQILLFLMICAWGVRLAVHIGLRNKGKAEDFRYRKWREEWGKWFVLRSFFQVFVLQGVLMLVVALPIMLTMNNAFRSIGVWQFAGCMVWLVGFLFESIGDWQLVTFKKNPLHKGKIMTKGLWRYTRHPNYFGEAMLWWGVWLVSLPLGDVFGILSPLMIGFLLLKVSGIPMLEKKYEGRPDFEEYKRKTSAFFPLPPKV